MSVLGEPTAAERERAHETERQNRLAVEEAVRVAPATPTGVPAEREESLPPLSYSRSPSVPLPRFPSVDSSLAGSVPPVSRARARGRGRSSTAGRGRSSTTDRFALKAAKANLRNTIDET